jgi:hypothetical protein
MYLRTCCLERVGTGIGTRHSDNMMARSDEFRHQGRTDEAGRSRQKYTHVAFPFCWFVRIIGL